MPIFQSFAFEQDLTARQEVEYLVVGGGGSGGSDYAGGGGGGGFRSGSVWLVTNQAYPIIVGDGGPAVGGRNVGINGGTSKLFGIEGAGGGGGGHTQFFDNLGAARAGGSGGGGGGARRATNNGGAGNTPSTSPSQGNNGGLGGTQASNGTAAGGGGAIQVGGNGENVAGGIAGRGGSGSLWLDGNRYAGGGGGSTFNTQTVPPLGGPGGGGKGSSSTSSTSGSKNTGGGGGGSAQRGGSGIVKFRYPGEPKPELQGGNITTVGGFTYHEFTSSNFLYYNASEQQQYNDNNWQPSNISGIKYWWRADMGVTQSSNNVSEWKDQISQYSLVNSLSASAYPYYSSSVSLLNNKEAICFNGTNQYLYTTGSPANFTSDIVMMYVCRIHTGSSGGTTFGVSDNNTGTQFRLSNDTFNNTYRTVYTSGSTLNITTAYTNIFGVAPLTGSANHFLLRYLRSDGDQAFSSGSISTLIYDYNCQANTSAWSTSSAFNIGGTIQDKTGALFSPLSPRFVKVDMAEIVVIYASPSDDDMVRWKNYVKKRYALDLT